MSDHEDWTFKDYFLDEYADAIMHSPPYKDWEIDEIYTRRKELKKISAFWLGQKRSEPVYVYEGRVWQGCHTEPPYGVYLWMCGYLPSALEQNVRGFNNFMWYRKKEKNFTQGSAIQWFARLGVRLTVDGPYKEQNMPDTPDGDGEWLT